MPGKILEELQQTKPFRYVEEEAFLNIHRTADLLMQELILVLKPFGLSATQYNVMRILRGAGVRGVTCKDIGARMLTREPDITRLLDRLEKRKLIKRNRAKEDRRFVAIRITQDGLGMLAQLDVPIQEMQLKLLHCLGESPLRELIHTLEVVRTCAESSVSGESSVQNR